MTFVVSDSLKLVSSAFALLFIEISVVWVTEISVPLTTEVSVKSSAKAEETSLCNKIVNVNQPYVVFIMGILKSVCSNLIT